MPCLSVLHSLFSHKWRKPSVSTAFCVWIHVFLMYLPTAAGIYSETLAAGLSFIPCLAPLVTLVPPWEDIASQADRLKTDKPYLIPLSLLTFYLILSTLHRAGITNWDASRGRQGTGMGTSAEWGVHCRNGGDSDGWKGPGTHSRARSLLVGSGALRPWLDTSKSLVFRRDETTGFLCQTQTAYIQPLLCVRLSR